MSEATSRRWRWLTSLLALVALIVALWLIHYGVYPYPVGPKQPLPFSHRIHAGVRQISCLFCHDSADRSKNAGMPEVRKCLLCHNVIITQFAPIRELHGYFDRGEPIPWRRVYLLADYEHFSHEMHLAAGVDCGQCRAMSRRWTGSSRPCLWRWVSVWTATARMAPRWIAPPVITDT